MDNQMSSDGDLDTARFAEEEGVGCSPKALYNGQLILTLSTGSACWGPRFEYSQCTEMLALHGLQVPPEDFELPLRRAIDAPELRRYLFFNSTLFLTLLAPVLYLVIWCSLFSSFHLLGTAFSKEYFGAFCLALSAAAVMVTGTIIMVLHCHHGKISMNTEVRLTQANELLANHHLLVGLFEQTKNCSSQIHLSFCYFNVLECFQRLVHLLEYSHSLQNRVKRKFRGLSVVVIQSSVTPRSECSRAEGMESEETPLLQAEPEADPRCRPQSSNCSLACCVAPVGTPQEMAAKLVALHSALYVKLLVTQGLPQTGFSLHAEEARVPCLCQLIESHLSNVCSF
ncbi:transmembrane protein 268-like [Ambystoma mexicanum]|uniref:transmembrane protein 268-like n=1 Tax=Ambystoma mexicanum TaxID=8296 RepID=UPI0037E7B7DF